MVRTVQFDFARFSGTGPDHWDFAAAPLDTPASAFGPFAELVDLWQERRSDGNGLPVREAFSAEDFLPWLSGVFIAKIEHNPFRLRYTLWGTQMTEWWGTDYTGKLLGEESLEPESWDGEIAYFRDMATDPFIGVACGTLDLHARGHIRVLSIDLPTGDESGLTHVIAVHRQIDHGASLRDILA